MTVLGSTYILRPATVQDAKHLVPRLKDIEEWDAVAKDGHKLLAPCIAMSDEAWTIAERKAPWVPHMIFGVVTEGNLMPTTWLTGSDLAERDAMWLLQNARPFMAEFFGRWPLTQCYPDSRNVVHHRWLKWLGYEFIEEVRMGHLNHPFFYYIKEP